MTEVNDNATQRDRSPAYPIVPLEVALARLVEFEAHFKRTGARREKVGEAWSIKAKAYADRTLAALGYFGLLEYKKGAGDGPDIVISEEGRKYLRAQQEQTKQEVVKAAALRPKQIVKFWANWGADRPADAACIDELTMKNGFSVGGARDFLKVYDDTISFAKLSDSDKITDDLRDEEFEGEADEAPPPRQPPPVQRQKAKLKSKLGNFTSAFCLFTFTFIVVPRCAGASSPAAAASSTYSGSRDMTSPRRPAWPRTGSRSARRIRRRPCWSPAGGGESRRSGARFP